jgi:hypothetical protein
MSLIAQSNQPLSQQSPARKNSQFKKLVVAASFFFFKSISHHLWFKQLFYKQKKYKKGLAAAREIFKKFPNHGSTCNVFTNCI